jgi:hypothetical protein
MRSCSRATRRFPCELLALCAVVALAACGGQSAAKRASAICTREGAAMRSAGGYEQRVRVARRELGELRALHERTLEPLVDALRREVDMADRLRIAATIGDTETAEGAYHLGQKAARDARRWAGRLGVAGCG